MGEAHLLSASEIKHNTGYVEASWRYEIAGSPEQAKATLRRAFEKNYQLTHEGQEVLSFARFDGADSFSLTFRLQPGVPNSTLVSIALRSTPG